MNQIFRAMLPEDIAEVEAMDRMILGTSIGKEALLTEIKENPLAHYFVLEDNLSQKPIGHIGLWLDEKNAQILNFYIIPEYRGKGLGKHIIEQVLNYLRLHACENLTLEVRPSNQKALRLYEKYGFQKAAVREKYYENGEDALLMWKKL